MQISRNYRANQTLLQLKPLAYFAALLLLLAGLSGCTQFKPEAAGSGNSILPVADSRTLPAVIKALLKQSDDQYANRNLAGALATLERAVRINPRYPEVWSRMAQIYWQQGNLEQAKQHAKRSNSVLKNNDSLKAFNDRMIGSSAAESVN